MDEKLDNIFEIAIKEEEYFMSFYADAADKTDKVSLKKLFLKLSEQEAIHKKRLMDLDLSSVTAISGKIESIDVTEPAMLTPYDELNDINEILNIAIANEIKAQDLYRSLAFAIDNPDAARLLKILADEEKKHEELLRKELV